PAMLTYTLTPSHPHFIFNPAAAMVSNPRVNYVTNFVAMRVSCIVSGRVTNAAGVGISGATVRDLAGSGLVTQTDAGGYYSFDQIPTNSTVTISIAKDTHTFSADQTFVVTTDRVADFLGSVVLRSISGVVTNSSGQGIGGVKIFVRTNFSAIM